MTTGDGSELDRAPRRRADVITIELDGEAVLYDPVDGSMHKLNAVGAVLWRFLDGTVTLRQLGVELAAEIPSADDRDVEFQLLGYTADLGRLGLLENSGD